MSFLNPLFLFALLTVGIPLLIYLLNVRKPKKIRFSTLAFFDSLKSTALKRIRIKRWLLLAIRCLAIAALVIAASRPFMPPGFGWTGENEPKVIGILVDNSPTMDRVDSEGPYIEQARTIAGDLIEMAESDDRIVLDVTNGSSLNTPVLPKRGALTRTGDIETINAGNFLKNRLYSMRDRLEDAREPNKIIYLITDGQRTQFSELLESEPDLISELNIQVLQLGNSETMNMGFENVELMSGNAGQDGNIRLRADVRNYSDQTARNQFINLYIDDELITQKPYQLDGRQSDEFFFDIPVSEERFIPVELLLEGDELSFDNRFFAAIQLPEERRILVLEEQDSGGNFNSYLNPMLEVAGEENERLHIEFERAQDFQVSDLYRYNAIVLDGISDIPDYLSQALLDHVQDGAGLLLMPAADGNLQSYNRLLSFSGAGNYVDVHGSYGSFQTIDRMQEPVRGHPILDTIFDVSEDEEIRLNVPEIFYYYGIESSGTESGFTILSTRTGRPLLNEARAGSGRIVYSAIGSDPGWSNFPVKPFFAPLFFRTIDHLVRGESAELNVHYLGEPFSTFTSQNLESVVIQKDGESIIPEVRQTFDGSEISYSGTEWTPGWMYLETSEQNILYSVNQHAMESELNSLDESDMIQVLNNHFANVQHSKIASDKAEMLAELEAASFGKEIWHWFIIISIILLLLESTVSRLYKAESI